MPVIGTMYTCPQLIRQSDGEADGTPELHVARAADMWSVCVTLYFLLFSKWPFEKSSIALWATKPRELWNDDKEIQYPGMPPPCLSPDPTMPPCTRPINPSTLQDIPLAHRRAISRGTSI